MKPTLVLLAAGMGSRYGGLKQLDGLGPNGETIMDYSIFDAIKAGFGKIVFIIRKDLVLKWNFLIILKLILLIKIKNKIKLKNCRKCFAFLIFIC